MAILTGNHQDIYYNDIVLLYSVTLFIASCKIINSHPPVKEFATAL